MNGRRAVIGLCMLCALAFSAFAAQGASAATKGTTAFTCVEGPKGGFAGEHCTESDGVLGGKFEHVAIPQDTTTEITGTNEKTANNTTEASVQKLKMTVAGVATELTATVLHGEGWLENKLEPNGEHYAEAHGTLTYSNVKVAKPLNKGCKVFTDNGGVKGEEGVVHTNPLKGTTTEEPEHKARITPTEGNVFATFIISGCEGEALKNLNQTYTVEGTVTCPIEGATVHCEHFPVTETGLLKVNGSINAGLEGSLTLKEKTSGHAISATTVETP